MKVNLRSTFIKRFFIENNYMILTILKKKDNSTILIKSYYYVLKVQRNYAYDARIVLFQSDRLKLFSLLTIYCWENKRLIIQNLM